MYQADARENLETWRAGMLIQENPVWDGWGEDAWSSIQRPSFHCYRDQQGPACLDLTVSWRGVCVSVLR